MALRTPPSWLQNGSHPAENDRLTMQGIVSSTGIIGTSSLQVTAQASPNMTVNVATGWAGIVSSTSNAGVYLAYNDATTVLTIGTADTVNNRKDIIVATVSDSYYSGSTNTVAFQVIAGTPSGSPTPPSTPSNSILLATITVIANTTTISAGNIADGRTVASSNLINGLSLPFTGGTLTGGLVLAGGSSSVAPLKITNSTVLGTATGGAVEYDGSVAYFTPSATAVGGHGLLPTEFFYANSAQRSLSSGAGGTTAQAVYGASSGAGVGLSLAGSTAYEYEIEGWVSYTTTSTTSNALTLQLTYGSVPTLLTGWFEYAIDGYSPIVNWVSTSSATNISQQIGSMSSVGSLRVNYRVKGIIRTNSAGTFTPQVVLSATNSSAVTVSSNAFAKVKPIGTSSVTNIGAWA